MTQNLRLRFTSGTPLTPATSDVVSSWTPTETTSDRESFGSSSPYEASSYDSGNIKYGVYYNWKAATAGSGSPGSNFDGQNVTSSICPKGWKLPRSDREGNQNVNDFEKLTALYGGNDHIGGAPQGFAGLTASPLSFVLSGRHSGKVYDQSHEGYYWSSTVILAHNSQYALSMAFMARSPKTLHARYYILPEYGLSVRCLVRDPDQITSSVYMQDVTREMCDATPLETEVALVDKRDNNSYRVTKGRDGKCWMSDNLRLRLSMTTRLTPETSDISSGWVPQHNTGTGSQGAMFASDYQKEYSHFFGVDVRGVHYTWAAATAGRGNASIGVAGYNVSESICPKGWKLPRSGQGTEGNDFHNLVESHGFLLIAAPYYFNKAGLYDRSTGRLDYDNSLGYFWSSTAGGNRSAYYLSLSNSINPRQISDRHYGLSVRCLVR